MFRFFLSFFSVYQTLLSFEITEENNSALSEMALFLDEKKNPKPNLKA